MLKSRYGGRLPAAEIDGHSHSRERKTSERAQQDQGNCLDDELADDSRPPGAKRHPHPELAHPSCGPRHHEIAQVRCRDDEHEAGEQAEQRDHGEHRGALVRSHEVVAGQQRLQPLVVLHFRVLRRHRLHRLAKGFARYVGRDAVAQAAVHPDAAVPPIPQKRAVRIEVLALPDGNEDVGHVELETGNRRRRNADDPYRFAIDVGGAAHEIRRGAKTVAPEAVAEHD